IAPKNGETAEQAAVLMKVSRSSGCAAETVNKRGISQSVNALAAGKVSVSAVARIARPGPRLPSGSGRPVLSRAHRSRQTRDFPIPGSPSKMANLPSGRRPGHSHSIGCTTICLAGRKPMASWARIKELVSLRKQGAQCAIAHLGISDPRKKSHARTIATLRACGKLHPGAWCLSYCAHKTKMGRPLCFGQGAQPDCAAHLGLFESATW